MTCPLPWLDDHEGGLAFDLLGTEHPATGQRPRARITRHDSGLGGWATIARHDVESQGPIERGHAPRWHACAEPMSGIKNQLHDRAGAEEL